MSKELKILINNEEVVCDKQISIDEKMLSTSSTILKNCYPKFWETDKDYVSRFYFPKDYSKCRISYDEFHPEEQGEIVTGTNLSINYDSTKNFELLQLQGNTYQQTYTGKNLCGIPDQTFTHCGVQVTIKNGEITLNGTSTSTGTKQLTPIKTTTLNGTYVTNYIYVSGTSSTSVGATGNFNLRNANGGTVISGTQLALYTNNSKAQFTISSDTSIIFGIYIQTIGVTYNNLKFKPQLIKGTSEDYNYEPYVGGTPSPNPDYPQPINNVTGRQTIDVVGKNLYDTSTSVNGYVNNRGSVVLEYKNLLTDYIKLTSGSKYTISVNTTFGNIGYAYFDSNKTYISRLNNNNKSSITLTIPNNVNYIRIWFNKDGATDMTPTNILQYEPMVELGESRTTYEEYKGQSYEINLGKNLFDKDNANVLNAYFNTSTNKLTQSGAGVKSLYIPCKPNTTYTVQKTLSTRFGVACTREIPIIGETIYNASVHATWSNITITTDSQAKYLVVEYYISSDTLTPEEIMDTIQIEQGSTATTYSSYFPPIELNKIGNYQDRIYKENDTWYIEKKIGKVVLDGSESWSKRNNGDGTNTISFTHNMLYGAYGTNNEYCDRFNYEQSSTSGNEGIGANSTLDQYYIQIKRSRLSSLDVTGFKSWLSSNNTILNYVLSTPTYTEITNTDLINQLESIELLYGINNITVTSPNVPGALKIHYNFKEAYTESDLVFCGVVKNTGNISLNPREPHYVDLQILDFKCLLSEGETLNYVINDKTIPEAIEQVVTSISDYGFVIGNINILNPNDKINAYSTLNKTAYDVFQYIADVTQSKWATRVIDEDTIAIDFYDPTLMPQASPIEYNQTYFENNDIENMTFNYSTNDYRNKQIMTSDEVFGNIEQIETIISNGYQDTYTCQNKIGIIKKITVNDVEYTFATKNEVELGVTADFIYQPGEIVFTSSQIYTSGSVIVITYLPIVKGREIVLNNEESSRISSQINRKGTISRYENRNDTTSGQELIKIGQSYIKYKGSAEITLKIVSSKNLFNVGQIVEFNAPLEELSTEYMVKNKTIDIWTIDSNETQVFYTYELSSNFNSENAINYFDNQRAKNQGNIGEGETIVRNIDIENTALIQFYQTNIEEVEISNISTLDFSLDAVLI